MLSGFFTLMAVLLFPESMDGWIDPRIRKIIGREDSIYGIVALFFRSMLFLQLFPETKENQMLFL